MQPENLFDRLPDELISRVLTAGCDIESQEDWDYLWEGQSLEYGFNTVMRRTCKRFYQISREPGNRHLWLEPIDLDLEGGQGDISISFTRYCSRLVSARSCGCDIHVSIAIPEYPNELCVRFALHALHILQRFKCHLSALRVELPSSQNDALVLLRAIATLHPCPRLGPVHIVHAPQSNQPQIVTGDRNLENHYMDICQNGDTVDGIVRVRMSKPLVGSVNAPEPWWVTLRVASFELYKTQYHNDPFPWPYLSEFLRSCQTMRTFKADLRLLDLGKSPSPIWATDPQRGALFFSSLQALVLQTDFSSLLTLLWTFDFPSLIDLELIIWEQQLAVPLPATARIDLPSLRSLEYKCRFKNSSAHLELLSRLNVPILDKLVLDLGGDIMGASPPVANLGAARHVEICIWTPNSARLQELQALDLSRCESLLLTVSSSLDEDRQTPRHGYQVATIPCTRLQRLHLDVCFFKPVDDLFTWIAENLGFGLSLEVEALEMSGYSSAVFSFKMCRAFEGVPYVESLRLTAEKGIQSDPVLSLRECTHTLFRHLRRLNIVFVPSFPLGWPVFLLPWFNPPLPCLEEFQLLLQEDESGSSILMFSEMEELVVSPDSSWSQPEPTLFDEIFRQLTDVRVGLSAYYSYDHNAN